MTEASTKPLFVFDRYFKTTIEIGDKQLPIRVKRLSKDALEELDRKWNALIQAPRGSAPLPPNASPAEQEAFVEAERERVDVWAKSVEAERLAFFEEAITEHISIDAGLIIDCGEAVTTGAGLLKIFHGRKDVLRDLIAAVITQNHLTEIMRKNSKSPRASGPGSEESTQVRGGDRPEPIAGGVAPSSTAATAGATDASNGAGDDPELSGASAPETAVH